MLPETIGQTWIGHQKGVGDFRSGAVVNWDQKRGEYITLSFTIHCARRFRLATLRHRLPVKGLVGARGENLPCWRYREAISNSWCP